MKMVKTMKIHPFSKINLFPYFCDFYEIRKNFLKKSPSNDQKILS